jgi:hypothetical protein
VDGLLWCEYIKVTFCQQLRICLKRLLRTSAAARLPPEVGNAITAELSEFATLHTALMSCRTSAAVDAATLIAPMTSEIIKVFKWDTKSFMEEKMS